MITYSSPANTAENKTKYEFEGKSTDTKPTLTDYPDMDNGSTFLEMDTKELKFWDADSETWI